MTTESRLTFREVCFLVDRACEIVGRDGVPVRIPNHGMARECSRPHLTIFYEEPETSGRDEYHRLQISADCADGGEKVLVLSLAWRFSLVPPIVDLKIPVCIPGPWRDWFLS
jgi:hypothetical protein